VKPKALNPQTRLVCLMKATLSVLYFFFFATGLMAQVPKLNSYPTARATIYLDFDGQYVNGSVWNWAGPINAQPAALTPAQIAEIHERVAEDYRIFNLNITTDSTVYFAAPPKQRMRVIVTPTYEWYAPAGGVSFVGSFTWGDETPAWVFSGLLGNSVKKVAEAISHEAGHTLGLQHQSSYDANCVKTAEYAAGQGTGEISWAPIMGVGYSRNLTTWHYGANTIGCDVLQDDISIIAGSANNFGLRSDDHSDTHIDATPVTMSSYDFSVEGLINTAEDKDVFRFTITSPTNFRLNAVPKHVGSNNDGANVDIKVSLLNSFADTIGRYNPLNLLNAGVDSNINAGTYYLVVEGVGNPNLADHGSVGYYSLSGTLGNILPVRHINLNGTVRENAHELNWSYSADEPVQRVEVEYSKDGKQFSTIAVLPSEATEFSWKPLDYGTVYYRVRVVTVADERAYYSKTISMQDTKNKPVKVLSNIISEEINVYAGKDYAYQLLDESGRLLQQGRLTPGNNRIGGLQARKGLLILRVAGNNEQFTFRLIKP
jgi:hypothetical protein